VQVDQESIMPLSRLPRISPSGRLRLHVLSLCQSQPIAFAPPVSKKKKCAHCKNVRYSLCEHGVCASCHEGGNCIGHGGQRAGGRL
jgi:hypothetical protein